MHYIPDILSCGIVHIYVPRSRSETPDQKFVCLYIMGVIKGTPIIHLEMLLQLSPLDLLLKGEIRLAVYSIH